MGNMNTTSSEEVRLHLKQVAEAMGEERFRPQAGELRFIDHCEEISSISRIRNTTGR